jgi:Cu-Zn family superoxide dismutase
MKAAAFVAGGLLVVGAIAAEGASPQTARAELRNAQGASVGTATLTEGRNGVSIALQLSNLPPGTHGFHIHAVGKCDPPGFTTAGGHFNPGARKHGGKTAEGPHAGDLPNLVVGADGAVKTEVLAPRVTLGPGKDSLLSASGAALVIHADADDEMTDPTGNSGARIACGVVAR